jgi:hypothetical protein
MAIRYFLAEEPIQNDQGQDCCLFVEIHAPDVVDDQWVQQAVENAIEEEFGKRLTLWSADQDEAFQYLQADPGATHGSLSLGTGVPLFWYLLRIL